MSRIDDLLTQLRIPSPLQRIEAPWTHDAGIQLFIKRDEAIHPHICGNKWRKLKYALIEAIDADYHGVITYGGAYSNHLVAVAAAAHKLGLSSCGIVRSYETHLNNPTLEICQSYGMQLHFVHPQEYKTKSASPVIAEILNDYSNYIEIPEGGTQRSAIKGVGEIIQELDSEFGSSKIDKIYTVVGSGGTLAGLAINADPEATVVGISPFKGALKTLAGIELLKEGPSKNWTISDDTLRIRFGAYSEVIVEYILDFYEKYGVILDPIYTSRGMMKVEQDCRLGLIDRGASIVMIHTGGLQGCKAYNHQYRKKTKLIADSILMGTI